MLQLRSRHKINFVVVVSRTDLIQSIWALCQTITNIELIISRARESASKSNIRLSPIEQRRHGTSELSVRIMRPVRLWFFMSRYVETHYARATGYPRL